MASKKKKSEKQKTAAAAGNGKSIQKRKKAASRRNDRWASAAAPLPSLVVRRPAPNISSKHTTYFEIVENTEKKKKLEFQVTTDRTPPPGFEFVPIGNPDLTKACKELSREQDAMIFIVSAMDHGDGSELGLHMNRVGHHIRRTIVENARSSLGQPLEYFLETASDKRPEPIPETQEEINAQADAAIRDLFPRMPNTDRQMVIDRSFRKGGGETVGLAADLTLSRRVQLAVLAHIRHTHTTYDDLWRTHGWATARKAIEATCLDFIVKWRGDEETGRDQLDEILREVIVISDSEDSEVEDDSDDDDDSEDDSSETEDSDQTEFGEVYEDIQSPRERQPYRPGPYRSGHEAASQRGQPQPLRNPVNSGAPSHRRINSTNFRRYEAVAQTRWEQARDRVRHEKLPLVIPALGEPFCRLDNHSDYRPYQPGNPQSQTLAHPARGHIRPGRQDGLLPSEIPPSGPRRLVDPRAPPISAADKGLELKDYLVPSIEPISPGNLNSPIFIRTLPPRVQERSSPNLPLRRRSRSPVYHSPQPPTVFGRSERGSLYSGPSAAVKYHIDGGGSSSTYVRSSDTISVGERSQSSYIVLPDDRRKYLDTHPYQQHPASGSSCVQTMPQPWPSTCGMASAVRLEPQGPYADHREAVLLRTEHRPNLIDDWGRGPRTIEKSMLAGNSWRLMLAEEPGRSVNRPASALARPFQPESPYTPTIQERGLLQPSFAGLPVVDHADPRAAPYSRRLLTSREAYSQPQTREFSRNHEKLPSHLGSVIARPPSPQYYLRTEEPAGRRQQVYADMPSVRFNGLAPDGCVEPHRARPCPPANLMDVSQMTQARQYPNETARRQPHLPQRVEYIQFD